MSTRQEDLKLDGLELRDAVVALKDVAGTQWYDLGLQLKLSRSVLDTIAADHQTSDDRKRMMLSKWLQSDSEASWERLAAALALIGHETTAANVRAQFVKVAVQVVAEADQDEIRLALTKNNLQKIKAKFSSLSHEVQSALQSNPASVNEVYSFLVRYFSRDDWIQNPSNFDQLFNALSVAKLWNYDHYGPLEEITKKFLPNDAAIKKLVSEYKSHLNGFYTTTKIADFIKVHKSEFKGTEQDPQESLPVETYTLKDYHQLKLTLKLERKISALTLSYVDELWRSLAEEFDLPSLTAVIHKIVKGSLQVAWLVLPHIAEKITSASTKAVKFFRLHDITRVEVASNIVFDEEKMTEYESQLFEIYVGEGDINAISELISQHGVDVNTINEEGYTALAWACHHGHSNVVKILLHYGANVNQQNNDEWGETPLVFACWEGHVDIAKLLVENGAIVNFVDKVGQSPLYVVSAYGETEAVRFLLEHGADVNLSTQDERAFTALMVASFYGDIETTRVLLDHGANEDYQNKGSDSSLHISSRKGHTEIVQLLLEHKDEVNLLSDDKLGNTALIEACQNKHAETARVLLDHGAAVDYCNKEGKSSLHISSRSGYDEVIEVLLKYGAQVNLPMHDEWGNTALMEACRGGHVETARKLLDHGANVDYQNEYGCSALLCASDAGNTECVKVLVKYGAQVDLPDEGGETALMEACRRGHVETARVLLHHGANVDHQNKNGQTILYNACGHNRLEIVKLLLEYGAQVNKANNNSYGDIPLTIVCADGCADVAMLLIDSGAIVNFQNKRGAAPLHTSCINGHSHVVKLLIERGADIDVQMKDQRTPLFLACFNGDLETVNVLLKAGAQPDIPRENGLTGLMVACQKGLADIAKALLEARADTDMTEESTGRTALFFAAEHGYFEIIKLLIIHGVDVDIKDKDAVGVTPLIIACINENIQCAQLLIEHGAVIDIIDKEGWTAIFYAAEKGYVDIVQSMMDRGVDLELKDKNGLTAYDVASINSHPDVCHLMEAYGYQAHHSATSETMSDTGLQIRRRRDEITSVQTFRALLSSQSLDDASLKHQTSQMFEESEETL